ncbi:hypothetical protein [Marinilabilia rubra]|uniref:Uncharacterized protein n=1 Tax=Marinilabilia rubra TaxID=2162893 RepID=A0A2U2BC04_9BACT|nr:hypothetical protein [Marinilabilia rubra]PWE00590.1 hypothetical protein DDZ16_03045 [Marinilabilia rubra]
MDKLIIRFGVVFIFMANFFLLKAQDREDRIENAGQHPIFRGNTTIIGWEGDKDAALLKPNGWFFIRDGINAYVSFQASALPGVPDKIKTGKIKWYPHSGYLPCFISEFEDNWAEFGKDDELHIKISNFADKVTIDENDFVIAYSRVSVKNNMDKTVPFDPRESAILTPLNNPLGMIEPGKTMDWDFAVVIDRFGNDYERPSDEKIKNAGSWDEHFEHMKNFWEGKLSQIAQINTPDQELNNAYRMGFIYTLISRDGPESYNVAEIGYDVLFTHDYLGIYLSLLKLGYFENAYNQLKLLGGGRGPYHDHYYRWGLLLSTYLQKTGDIGILEKEDGYLYKKSLAAFDTTMMDMTGPYGLLEETWDIDHSGLWTWDNESALTGFTCLEYIANMKGDKNIAKKARTEFTKLMTNVNNRILTMQKENGINYIPCSLEKPNEDFVNVMKDNSSMWATPFWFGMNWNTYLAGGKYEGPLKEWVDNTYKWGYEKQRKSGARPHNVGTWVSYGGGVASAYNSAFSISGLFSQNYRQEAIKSYQFLLKYGQSAPYGFWEMFHEVDPENPWEGNHPSSVKTNWYACPHQWGQAGATQALLDALVAEFYDGRIMVGRGYIDEWMVRGKKTEINNFPVGGGKRTNFVIEMLDQKQVKLSWSGNEPQGEILFNLPQFRDNIASVSTGKVDEAEDWVVVKPSKKEVIVTLK